MPSTQVFVTNLPWSERRRDHISRQFDRLNIEFEFVDCVIGKELTEDQKAAECDLDAIKVLNEESDWFNDGMIGCTLTSRNIHSEIVRRNLDSGVLIEDDAVLPPNFKEILEDCVSKLLPGDVILLFWTCWEEVRLKENTKIEIGGGACYEPENPKWIGGGTATVFSKEAAKGMAEVNTPIKMSPDCWNYFKEAGAISRILCAYPIPVSTADFMSTMELGRFVGVRRLIDKYKIPPFYQFLRYRRKRFRKGRVNVRLV